MAQRDSFFGRATSNPAANPSTTPASTETQSSGYLRDTPAATPPAPGKGFSTSPTVPERVEVGVKPNPVGDSESRGSQLIVGPKIRMKGVEIVDCDTLVVEGHIEAAMDSRVIQIAAGGTFIGTLAIDDADIHGSFSGELVARKCLTIHASGKVSGKIRYKKLVVEEGGEISGEVSTSTDGQPASFGRPSTSSEKTDQVLLTHA